LIINCNFPGIHCRDNIGAAETAVYIICPAGTGDRYRYHRLPTRKASFREILVFWSSAPEFATRSASNVPWDSEFWGVFVIFLLYAQKRKYPKEYIYVNIESAVSKLYKQGQRVPLSECEAAAAHFRQQVKVNDRLSRVKITFLSMRDYLKNYDWTGELRMSR
jgi:hypothetical protein